LDSFGLLAMGWWPTYGNTEQCCGRITESQLSTEGAIFPSCWEGVAPYFAEFIGTFVLTLTFVYNYSSEQNSSLWAVSANAFMMMCFVYAFGHVSGANFNPSVCIALWLSGRYRASVALTFCLAQILGSVCAAVVAMQSIQGIDIGPKDGYSWGHVLLVESMYSGLICLVYLNCAASMKCNPPGDWNGIVGLAVGFSFIAGGYASKEVANTVFNSAISLGIAIVDCQDYGVFSWDGIAYFLYDLLGAVIGASFYRILRPAESSRSFNLGERDVGAINSTLATQVAAELIGTYYVVITKALNRLDDSETASYEAWSVAAVVMALAYSFKDISGAFFNPAVTISVYASGRKEDLTFRVVIIYISVQVMAGMLASSTFLAVHGAGITISFGKAYTWQAAALSEMLFSLLTCYTVLSAGVAVDELLGGCKGFALEPDGLGRKCRTRQNNVAGLAYAACQIVAGFSVGNISGSILNPAIVLGFSGLQVLSRHADGVYVQYIFYEVVGALLASALFFVTHAHLYREQKVPEECARPLGSSA
jgi:glycerol uptake facilitator-like aquaporin